MPTRHRSALLLVAGGLIRTVTDERVKQLRVNPDTGQLNVVLNIDGLALGVCVDVRDHSRRATEKLVDREPCRTELNQ